MLVRMRELARSYRWWPNADLEIAQTVRNCSSFQQVRKPPPAALLGPWMWPSNPWHHIHIDFTEDEKRHYFILVDAHSRWPEIFYMPRNTTAASTITILRELFAKYGMPVHCVNDNGPFRSEKFARFLKMTSTFLDVSRGFPALTDDLRKICEGKLGIVNVSVCWDPSPKIKPLEMTV